MAQKLKGKVAVVTGAGSEIGIGKETAKAMAAEGAGVVVNDIGRDPDGNRGADRVVNEIKAADGTAVANYDSVASMAGGANIIKSAIDNFGRIDILVNAAGNILKGSSEKDWDAVINVHLKGLFACTRAALKEMLKQKSGGRIINITSINAWLPFKIPETPATNIPSYDTAKAGVIGFSKMLSVEMKEHGITVNAISPKAATSLFFQQGGTVGDERKLMGPEYVAPIIVYLATDEAEDITGQIIFAGSGDIMVYAPLMNIHGAHQHMHKNGKWTVDELIEIMPKMWWGSQPSYI